MATTIIMTQPGQPAAALGLVLIVFGTTTEGLGLVVWFGAAAVVVVALVGVLALCRRT